MHRGERSIFVFATAGIRATSPTIGSDAGLWGGLIRFRLQTTPLGEGGQGFCTLHAEAEAKHKPTGLTKLADQAGTVRRVRARAGRLAGLGAAK
jgi:hypothetical protein